MAEAVGVVVAFSTGMINAVQSFNCVLVAARFVAVAVCVARCPRYLQHDDACTTETFYFCSNIQEFVLLLRSCFKFQFLAHFGGLDSVHWFSYFNRTK